MMVFVIRLSIYPRGNSFPVEYVMSDESGEV